MYSFTLVKNDLVVSELAYAVSQMISLTLEAKNTLNNQSKHLTGQLICDFFNSINVSPTTRLHNPYA